MEQLRRFGPTYLVTSSSDYLSDCVYPEVNKDKVSPCTHYECLWGFRETPPLTLNLSIKRR
jgi:hypothetical protein